MKTSTRLIAGLLATVAASIAPAADIDMCATVPAGDVESALGIKVGSTKKGLRECTWITPDYSIVVIASVSYAAKDGKLGKASTTDYVEGLKTVGRKATVTDDTPTLWCAKIEGGSSPMVQCRAIAKAFELSVVANGSTMTPAQVKALVAKISARLP